MTAKTHLCKNGYKKVGALLSELRTNTVYVLFLLSHKNREMADAFFVPKAQFFLKKKAEHFMCEISHCTPNFL